MIRARMPSRCSGEALEDGAVLAVDRQDAGAGRGAARVNSSPAETRHSLLARAMSRPPDRGQRRREPSRADDGGHHQIDRPPRRLDHACGPAAHSMPLPASMLLSSP